jgi:hypothetical protein
VLIVICVTYIILRAAFIETSHLYYTKQAGIGTAFYLFSFIRDFGKQLVKTGDARYLKGEYVYKKVRADGEEDEMQAALNPGDNNEASDTPGTSPKNTTSTVTQRRGGGGRQGDEARL